jgi:hypothetical protein
MSVRHEAWGWNGWKTPLPIQVGNEPLGRSAMGMHPWGEIAGPERYRCGAMQAAKRLGLAENVYGE